MNMKKRRVGKRRRGVKRLVANRNFRNAVIKQAIAELAADRSRHYDCLVATWETATENLDNAAEAFITHAPAAYTADHVEAFVKPFHPLTIALYAPLMDELTPEEEALFRETATAFISAWQKFTAAVTSALPAAKAHLDAACDAARTMADELTDLFTGEAPPCLAPDYMPRLGLVKDTLGAISKELLP